MPANRFEISALPCLRLSRIGSLTAAKNGERDPARLYEQALKAFGIDDTSMLFVSVGRSPAPSLRFGHARRVTKKARFPPPDPGFLSPYLAAQAGTAHDKYKTTTTILAMDRLN